MKQKLNIYKIYELNLDDNERVLHTGTIYECAEALRNWIDSRHTIAEIETMFSEFGSPTLFLNNPEEWLRINGGCHTEIFFNWYINDVCSADARLTPGEFHEIRNQVYSGLVDKGIIKESDETFMAVDDVLGNTLKVDWEK